MIIVSASNNRNNEDIRKLESKIAAIDPKGTQDQLNEREALRNEYRTALTKKRSLESTLREKQLHLDSTPRGRKSLEANESIPNRQHRLENAKAMNAWHKELRTATDSKGNKYVAGNADLNEQHSFYASKLKTAQGELQKEQEELKMYHERYKAPSPFLTDKTSTGGMTDQNRKNAVASTYRATAIRARVNLLSRALKDTEKQQGLAVNEAKVNTMKNAALSLDDEAEATENQKTMLGKAPANESARLRFGGKAEVLKESSRQLKVRQDKPEELEKFRTETVRRRALAVLERDNAKALPVEKNLAIGAVAAYDVVLEKLNGGES